MSCLVCAPASSFEPDPAFSLPYSPESCVSTDGLEEYGGGGESLYQRLCKL
ncbi:MAG: hypothetical protein ACRY3E_01210 [Candidatus Lariskella arthropodorum]